ncbi:MAG: DNA methyltransferase [Pirellulales bacterium]
MRRYSYRMTPHEFIAKWQAANLSERSACQQHFLDLCDLLGQPKPAAADPDGAWYTFERGVRKQEGGHGWADVWKKDCFGWEYKGKHKNLEAAYRQLLLYREDLDNPPLLVVCDLDRFEIHTNFTGTAKVVHAFDLSGLADPANLDTLRKLFTEPGSLKPGLTSEVITKRAAERFGQIADKLRIRGIAASDAAHFLMKLMFCMFAEDIKLLPDNIFTRTLQSNTSDLGRLAKRMAGLFTAMAEGGDFGPDSILYFNGGLFADADVVELRPDELKIVAEVNAVDWSNVEPSIFGTLFERTLDPAKRSQIGAHYTSPDDIKTLLEPVVMTPLRREWQAAREKCDELWKKVKANAKPVALPKKGRRAATATPRESKAVKDHNRLIQDFVERLSHLSILDPACGSGNFLYVAINLLLDLEKEVIVYAAQHSLNLLPHVRPTQLSGIEINPYAQQLAQVVIWIGYLQWMHHNGFNPPRNPVLEPIESIRRMDAILDLSDPENPKEPEWPKADFIVGNPPFLGGKLLRTHLGDEYVDAMFATWDERVPREADLCCYWFEKARQAIANKQCGRAGLLATQGIRGNSNRKVLDNIKNSGDIFFAISDRDWVLDGAAVHVSIIGFDDGTEAHRCLNDTIVAKINADLSSQADLTSARRLSANLRICFMADTKGGAFDLRDEQARDLLNAPNPNGRPNSDVVFPWVNGLDVTRRPRGMWIIDFGTDMTLEVASRYELPFLQVEREVRPIRAQNKRESYRKRWWIHVEPRPAMREALRPLNRFLTTIGVGKHRVFVWMQRPTLPDHQVFSFANDSDELLGLLHSRVHEAWARRMGTQVRERESGFRYTPTTCFETFPFPEPTDEQRAAIGEAARELDRLRTNWLNPPEWTREEVLTFPGSVDGPWARYVHDTGGDGIGTVRYPRVVARDEECAKQLKKRTLTNLYNQRPTWLALAHERLDAAVAAAYGWAADLSEEQILERLLALNLERAGK